MKLPDIIINIILHNIDNLSWGVVYEIGMCFW